MTIIEASIQTLSATLYCTMD